MNPAELRERVDELCEEFGGCESELRELAMAGQPVSDDLRAEGTALAERLIAELNRLEQTDPDARSEYAELRRRAQDAADYARGGPAIVRLTQQPLAKLTDYGNAERIAAQHSGDLLHVFNVGWHSWDGRRWRRDDDGAAMRAAKQTARSIRDEAREIEDKDTANNIFKWATRSEEASRLEAMLKLARSEEGMYALPEHLDADPDLLTVENGTMDLTTGELRAHDPADLITRLAPVA